MEGGTFGSLAEVIFHFLKTIPDWHEERSITSHPDVIKNIIDGNGIFFIYFYISYDSYELSSLHFGYINFKDKFFISHINGDDLYYKLKKSVASHASHAKLVELFDKWEK